MNVDKAAVIRSEGNSTCDTCMKTHTQRFEKFRRRILLALETAMRKRLSLDNVEKKTTHNSGQRYGEPQNNLINLERRM